MPIPFKFLGFTHDGRRKPNYTFYFLPDHFGYPVAYKKSVIDNHKIFTLHNIAAPEFWQAIFPGVRPGKVDWIRAKDWVTAKSFQAGIYVPPDDGERKILKGK